MSRRVSDRVCVLGPAVWRRAGWGCGSSRTSAATRSCLTAPSAAHSTPSSSPSPDGRYTHAIYTNNLFSIYTISILLRRQMYVTVKFIKKFKISTKRKPSFSYTIRCSSGGSEAKNRRSWLWRRRRVRLRGPRGVPVQHGGPAARDRRPRPRDCSSGHANQVRSCTLAFRY